MPSHKINAKTSYAFSNYIDLSLGIVGATGVYLRGDESNQLNKTSPYLIFNIETVKVKIEIKILFIYILHVLLLD